MYPGYAQDKAHADVMDFRFKSRIAKAFYLPLGFILGFAFLPIMAAWTGGAESLHADFMPTNGVGYLLFAVFTIQAILTTGLVWLFIRNWEYHYAPQGYDCGKWW